MTENILDNATLVLPDSTMQGHLVMRDGHGSLLKVGQTLTIEADADAVQFFDVSGRAMAHGSVRARPVPVQAT